MKTNVTNAEKEGVIKRIEEKGFEAGVMQGKERMVIGVRTAKHDLAPEDFENLPGVMEVKRVTKPYRLASREYHPHDSSFEVGGVTVGDGKVSVIAGPCAVESEEQLIAIAHGVKKAGAAILRGGAIKPRTSPYSYRGIGPEGYALLKKAGLEVDMPVVSEVTRIKNIEEALNCGIDILQVGMRNMSNFDLLEEVAKAGVPVLLKRGDSATLDQFLQSAEYLLHGGCDKVMLCLRGIRTFEQAMRNTPDLGAIAALQELSHLPIFFDPSHSSGHDQYVPSLSKMAIAGGAHGLMIEVHHCPDEALCDGQQSITPLNFGKMMRQIEIMAQATGKEISTANLVCD